MVEYEGAVAEAEEGSRHASLDPKLVEKRWWVEDLVGPFRRLRAKLQDRVVQTQLAVVCFDLGQTREGKRGLNVAAQDHRIGFEQRLNRRSLALMAHLAEN